MKCIHCGQAEAALIPKLLLYASLSYGRHPPAEMFSSLPFCPPCSSTRKVEHLMPRGAFEAMADKFASIGKARPVYERTALTFIPIDSPGVAEFLRKNPPKEMPSA